MKDKRASSAGAVAKESELFLHNIFVLGRNVVRINKGTRAKHSRLLEEMKALSSNLKV